MPPFRKPTEAELAEALRRTVAANFARQIPTVRCDAALNTLHDRLVEDGRLYASNELQDQRDAVADAMIAVTDFLLSQGFAHRTLAPIMRPLAALAERENNALDLMFTERARVGRPKATVTQHERTGILAALAEEWLRLHRDSDSTQSQKLAQATRKMTGRWFGKVTSAQLRKAREIVSQEAADHAAVTSARMMRKKIDDAAIRVGAENVFPLMVRMLNDLTLPFGAGEGGISKTPGVSATE